MIQYALKCDNDHTFDSWFQSASAFDKLKSAGMIICETCGSSHINTAIMAPNVAPSRKQVTLAPQAEETPVAEIQKTVAANSEYVGQNFAKAFEVKFANKVTEIIYCTAEAIFLYSDQPGSKSDDNFFRPYFSSVQR